MKAETKHRVDTIESMLGDDGTKQRREIVDALQRIYALPESKPIRDLMYQNIQIHPPFSKADLVKKHQLELETQIQLLALAKQQGYELLVEWIGDISYF